MKIHCVKEMGERTTHCNLETQYTIKGKWIRLEDRNVFLYMMRLKDQYKNLCKKCVKKVFKNN